MSQQEQDDPSCGVNAIQRDDQWVRGVLTQYAPAGRRIAGDKVSNFQFVRYR